VTPRLLLHYAPNGPGRMTCRRCGLTISTNALARASHERGDECDRRVEARKRKGVR
jgi:hypothetical protein